MFCICCTLVLTGTKPHQDILEDDRIDILPIVEHKGFPCNVLQI